MANHIFDKDPKYQSSCIEAIYNILEVINLKKEKVFNEKTEIIAKNQTKDKSDDMNYLTFDDFLKPEAYNELLNLFYTIFKMWYLNLQHLSSNKASQYTNFSEDDYFKQQDLIVTLIHKMMI